MMQVLLGFIIALCMGLTGIGGGSFTAPALMLVAGLSGSDAVGTALVFSMIVRLAAAPFYVAGKQVQFPYLKLMLLGALPGLMVGTFLLASLDSRQWNHLVVIAIGITLVLSSALTFIYRKAAKPKQQSSAVWLPLFAFAIGIETGFSSAGAGALGTILLLNYSDMTTSQVVGTDIVFGIVLAAAGALLHFSFGSLSTASLEALLVGGIPGVLLGCILAPRVPSIRLKPFIVGLTLLLGLELVWSGMQ